MVSLVLLNSGVVLQPPSCTCYACLSPAVLC
jgi:hypothetical protein